MGSEEKRFRHGDAAEKLRRNKTASRLINAATILGLLLAVGFAVYGFYTGIFTSEENLERFISDSGVTAPLVFIFIQIIQVVVPIIPGGDSCLASVVLFGPLPGFVYSYAGICIGSTIGFFLGRFYGKPFILAVTKPETYEKYSKIIDKGKRFEVFFLLAMLFPAFPDDLICMLAGLTKMESKKFLLILLLAKIPAIALYSLVWASAEDSFWRLFA